MTRSPGTGILHALLLQRRLRTGGRLYSVVRELALRALPLALFAPATLVAQAPVGQDLRPDLIRARCEAVHSIDDQAVVFGYVVDGRTDTPLPGSTVHLSWLEPRGLADTTRHEVETEATEGAYIFCDVPQRTALDAWADALGRASRRTELWFEGGETERRDLHFAFARDLGALAGRLVDATTGEPIQAATIQIRAADLATVTDPDGRFRLDAVPTGAFEAEVAHVAYGNPEVEVTIGSRATTHLEIRLAPAAIELEPIAVTIAVRPQWLESNGFYTRQESSLGQFVTPRDIENQRSRPFSEILRTVPGVHIRRVCRPHCVQVVSMTTTTRSRCWPTFYVDGRKMTFLTAEVDLDGITSTQDLAAVEVYRGISQTPPQFFGLCGSIVIWTRRGAG